MHEEARLNPPNDGDQGCSATDDAWYHAREAGLNPPNDGDQGCSQLVVEDAPEWAIVLTVSIPLTTGTRAAARPATHVQAPAARGVSQSP